MAFELLIIEYTPLVALGSVTLAFCAIVKINVCWLFMPICSDVAVALWGC
ncbi:MAG: hypothetical protein ACK5Z5_04565 [Neisseriaceae bacterium]